MDTEQSIKSKKTALLIALRTRLDTYAGQNASTIAVQKIHLHKTADFAGQFY